jgi:FlaA1/EpsC-like NDP-sugar epimerase
MTETESGAFSKIYDFNDRLREYLGKNTMFYIGLANTLLLVSSGSIITYVAASVANAGVSVASASFFGVASAVCMYMFTKKYGPTYRSGIEDSIVSVLSASVVISLLPLFLTDILKLTEINAFLSFIVSILVIILIVMISNYQIVFSVDEP